MNPLFIEQPIQVRLQQAKESLEEAETLYRSDLLRGAIITYSNKTFTK